MGLSINRALPVARHSLKQQRGFTIVEVMIVLAIAGLIVLLIFKIIPTLNRSSQNNQRRQDVAAILQAVSHYELNNSANFPPSSDVNKTLDNTKLYFYDLSLNQVTFTAQSNTAAVDKAPHTANDTNGNQPLEWVEVVNYAKCKDDGSGGSSKNGADYTSIVALFAIEGANGASPRCQQL